MLKNNKNKENRFDGFAIEIFLDSDNQWVAHFEELPNISAFGDSPEEALQELETAWFLTKETYESKGQKVPEPIANKNFSGRFNVRVDKRVHKSLAIEAAKSNLSLNALVSQKLALSIGI